VQGAKYDNLAFPDTPECNITHIQASATGFDRLNNAECIQEYAKDFVPKRRNVILIVSNASADSKSLLGTAAYEFPPNITSAFNPYSWICDNPNVVEQVDACCENQWGFVPCSLVAPKLEKVADTWITGGYLIDHCLSEPVESHCHLHFAFPIMLVIIIFNVLKVISMACVAFLLEEQPLSTIGDAIQTFTLFPDPTSKDMCLADHQSIQNQFSRGYVAGPARYEPQETRWWEAATRKQWLFCVSLSVHLCISGVTSLTSAIRFLVAMIGIITALALSIKHLKSQTSVESIWSIGLGNVRPQNLMTGWNLPSLGNSAIAVSTVVANLPQAAFSFIYVVYNTLFTSMLLSYEWSKCGVGRKPLRVSDAAGEQKSTYFLHIPYKYGIPLIIGSGLLHWLVSQSIFLANISIIPRDGNVPMKDEITTCGYSPLGMVLTLTVCAVLVIYLAAIGCRKLPSGMPLVCSNSLAISAACHTDRSYTERREMVLQPVMWGALPSKVAIDIEGEEVGHCAFTDGEVRGPERGALYF